MSTLNAEQIRVTEAKLDIICRYIDGEGTSDGDYSMLANDYGGTGYEKDPVVQQIHDWAQSIFQARRAPAVPPPPKI